MSEEWRPVPDYEGLYEVSDLGRVRSLTAKVRNGNGGRMRQGRVLKQQVTRHGYYTVMLSRDGVQQRLSVSRLVGVTFLRIGEGDEVDHRDRDPLNNCVSNLRRATRAQNHMNTRRPVHNSSGFKGVSWHKARGMWRASISIGNRTRHLGHFDDPEAAHRAYVEAAKTRDVEFAHAG